MPIQVPPYIAPRGTAGTGAKDSRIFVIQSSSVPTRLALHQDLGFDPTETTGILISGLCPMWSGSARAPRRNPACPTDG